MNRYPARPGWKEETTSKAAAELVAPRAIDLRRRVLDALFRYGPATADEIAATLGENPISTRPRVTELAKLGKVEPTGERRRNPSGASAKVWRLSATNTKT